MQTRSLLGLHEIAYEAALRRIKGLTPAASIRFVDLECILPPLMFIINFT